jgi:hypothetical protein
MPVLLLFVPIAPLVEVVEQAQAANQLEPGS